MATRRGGCFAWGCGITLLVLAVAGFFTWRWYTREVKPWIAEKREELGQLRGAIAAVADAGLLDQLQGQQGQGGQRGQAAAEAFPLPELIPSFAEAPAFDTASPTDASAYFHASAPGEALVAELRELGQRAGFSVVETGRDEKSPARTLELSRSDLLVRADVLATSLPPGVDVFVRVEAAPALDGGAP